jgi:HAD superfamily hydrolase (TIGR01509 family)
MGRIEAIITDFDGTLVDTFKANYYAYKEAFIQCGYELTEEQYKECYGLRYDALCDKMNIKEEHRSLIKELKKKIYPSKFKYLYLNENLINFIIYSKNLRIKTCIASTASKENLYNVLNHFRIKQYFDVIITGEDVKFGKPNPEVYIKALEKLNIKNDQAIVFEDSEVGCLAAYDAGINYIKIC